jgi:pimeloyl-ACP methyl ester carboxylesterase
MPVCRLTKVQLFYEEKGQGDPLVFLSSLAGDHLAWLGQLRAFSKGYHCYAIDNRDSGQSTYLPESYSIETLAGDLIELFDRLEIVSCHLVGASMGGMIAQELAIRHPERVSSLVLANTLGRSDEWFQATLNAFEILRLQSATTAAFFDTVMPWWVSYRFMADKRADWLKWLLTQNPHGQQLDGFRRQLTAVRRHDTLGRLEQIQCPVLILVGEDDTVMPPRYGVELKERILQAQLVTLPGVGHAAPIEDPHRFNAQLRTFLATLPGWRKPDRQSA